MNAVKFIVIMFLLSLLCFVFAIGINNGKISLEAYAIKDLNGKIWNSDSANNFASFTGGVFILVMVAILLLLALELEK